MPKEAPLPRASTRTSAYPAPFQRSASSKLDARSSGTSTSPRARQYRVARTIVGSRVPGSIPSGSQTSTAIRTSSRIGMWSAWLRSRVLAGPIAPAPVEGASPQDAASASRARASIEKAAVRKAAVRAGEAAVGSCRRFMRGLPGSGMMFLAVAHRLESGQCPVLPSPRPRPDYPPRSPPAGRIAVERADRSLQP